MEADFSFRNACSRCHRTEALCFCPELKPFSIEPLLILLVHPREYRKTVGTARIVHLSIQNSILWRGYGNHFDGDIQMQKLLRDSNLYPMILFPGPMSLNLSEETTETLKQRLPDGKRLALFVIDGTWATASKMIRDSLILNSLPKLSFNVTTPSHYQFRKQPKAFCLSTVEAVLELLENLSAKELCTLPQDQSHQHLSTIFQGLVQAQLDFQKNPENRQQKLRDEMNQKRMF